MGLEKQGLWWIDAKTHIQIATSDVHSGGFNREQAEEIIAQLKDVSFRRGENTHRKVRINGKDVYVTLWGYDSQHGSVEFPYLKRIVNGEPKYLYELTDNPLEILNFRGI